MAKDVKLVIAGSVERAEAEIRKLQRTGSDTASILERDFEMLGTQSSLSIEKQRAAYINAYNKIKASGVATNDEIKRAQTALNGKLEELDQKTKGATASTIGLKDAYAGLAGAIVGLGLAGFVADVVKARAEMDKINNSLGAVFGSSAGNELAFIRSEAERLGLSLQTVSKDYASLAASAKGTTLEGENTRKIFSAVAEASTVMGLSAEETSGVIQALSQMMSKGTVQSEELKGQLGERLPGAMQLAAEAMGVTTGKLQSMLESGAITADVMLPKLAAAMERRFGSQIPEAVHSTQAELNRLENAWFNLKTSLSESGILPGLIADLTALADGVSIVTTGMSEMKISLQDAFISPLTSAWHAIQNVKNGMSFADSWSEMMAEMDANSALAVHSINELEEKLNAVNKVKPSDANRKAMEATQKQVQTLSASFAEYEKNISGLGKTQLDFASSGFSADLQRQSEYLKTNSVLASNLKTPLQEYLSVIETTYSKQLELETAVGNALKTVGAEQKAIAQNALAYAEVEKAGVAARYSAWNTYLTNLKSMYQSTMDGIKTKQAELFNIKMTTADLTAQVQAKLLSPMENYYATITQLENKTKLAASLSSEEKIKLLQSVQQQWASLTNEIKDGETTVVSEADAVSTALSKIKSVGTAIEQEKAAQIGQAEATAETLKTSMQAAAAEMESAKAKVMELDNMISGLNRSVALTIDDKASPVAAQVKAALDSIRDKEITITAVYRSAYADSYGGSAAIPSYDVGTPYVPKTGLALIHKGERIVTASDNARGNYGGGTSITIPGGINVTVQGGTPAETGTEIARQTWAKYEELAQSRKTA